MRKQKKEFALDLASFSQVKITKEKTTHLQGGEEAPPPPIVHEDVIDH